MMKSIEEYYKVERGPVFLLGNGPSLNDYDLTGINPDHVITMNRSWKRCPGARYWLNAGNLDQARKTPQNIVFFAGDESAVRQDLLMSLKCPVILLQTSNAKLKPKHLKLDLPADLDLRNGWPRNSNIGLMAVFWAWWVGFKPIITLGFDGYGKHFVEESLDRREDLYATKHVKAIAEYKQRTEVLRPHVLILNCNEDNAYGEGYISFEVAKESCGSSTGRALGCGLSDCGSSPHHATKKTK